MKESIAPAEHGGTSSRDPGLLAEVLERALSRGAEYGDLFVDDRLSLRLHLEDGRMEPIVWGHEQGAGIRLIHHGITQYVYTDDLGEAGLMGAVDALLRGNVPPGHGHHIPPSRDEPAPHPWMDAVEAMEVMRAAEEAARAWDPSIFQVAVHLVPFRQRIQVVSSGIPHVSETRSGCTLTVQVLARKGGRVSQGKSGRGGAFELSELKHEAARKLGEEAAGMAVRLLDAGPTPAGEQTVVLGGGWGGVLLHEACGHGLEADFVQRGSSFFAGKRGRRVAAEGVSVIDDPTRPGARGSYGVDDEGTPARPKILIENGVLVGYLHDVRTGLKEGVPSTGNGRRESFRFLPLPRMSNICMQPGPYDPREILENTSNGIYVAGLGGGSVDLGSGDFVFSVTEAYRIEEGTLGRPIQGATLIGRASEVLREIDMVGSDLQLDPGYGVCAKEGQRVPCAVGQPTLRVPKLVVGGTEI